MEDVRVCGEGGGAGGFDWEGEPTEVWVNEVNNNNNNNINNNSNNNKNTYKTRQRLQRK